MQGGDWLAPTLAGEPFVDQPPLVHATAALFGSALTPLLAPHDAARVAAGAMLALTLVLLAATARELYGRDFRWMPVLLFVGTVGLWDRAHQLSPEVGLLAGIALALYGFALALRRPAAGGALLGLGSAVAFLACGFIGPLWLTRHRAAAAGDAPGLAHAPLRADDRRRPRRRPAARRGVAARARRRAPRRSSHAWWAAQSLGDFFAPLSSEASADPIYVRQEPALVRVARAAAGAVDAVHARARLQRRAGDPRRGRFRARWRLVITACLLVMAEPRAIYAMPLMLPLCLARRAGGRHAAARLLRRARLVRHPHLRPAGGAGVVGCGSTRWRNGISPAIARVFRDTEPGYRPPLHWLRGRRLAVPVAAVAGAGPAGTAHQPPRGAELGRRDDAGVGALHVDLAALPRLAAQLPAGRRGAGAAAAGHGLRRQPQPGRRRSGRCSTISPASSPCARRLPGDHDCALLLVQYGRRDGDAGARTSAGRSPGQGARRGDDTERFVLFRKTP